MTDPHFDAELAAMEAEMAAAELKPPVQVLGEEDWETVADDRFES